MSASTMLFMMAGLPLLALAIAGSEVYVVRVALLALASLMLSLAVLSRWRRL